MSQRVAIYPGSFDPPTNGHRDIVERSPDGIWVIDPMGNNNFCDNKTRALYFDLSGRISSKVVKSGSTSCPGVPPPC